MKEVDIIPVNTQGDFEVRKRDSFDGYEYEGSPLFGPASDCDCIEWCDERGYDYRHRKYVALVVPKFFRDLEERADRLTAVFKEYGLVLRSDVTYRASAAWKDHPTHYSYIGDFGGRARLENAKDGESCSDAKWTIANGHLRELFGMMTALWELGFVLTFDKDGKHRIFSTEEWVTIDERD